ncbi:hypothetical protein ACFSC3_01600 [Sphingomonas floccifaciens]|uniref:Uncharacterized protein n=1 Tax=Sphingomonas floccifaciens TaxID=1844115 RepID=A0ABW4N898_9SPHN
MFEVLAFSCSLLLSFVLTGVERNHRQRRPHAPVLVYAGYALVGLLSTSAVLLTGYAAGSALGYV